MLLVELVVTTCHMTAQRFVAKSCAKIHPCTEEHMKFVRACRLKKNPQKTQKWRHIQLIYCFLLSVKENLPALWMIILKISKKDSASWEAVGIF